MTEMNMDTGIKNFYPIKFRTVLAFANMGFNKLMIDLTNFGLI